jgi:formamidopyrimidine-DNA glycosylase
MPELPDIEGFRRVAQHAVGHRVEGVRTADSQVLRSTTPDELASELKGRTVSATRRHGKWLTLHTGAAEGYPAVFLHFGMTGMLVWCEPETRQHPHDRVMFEFGDGELRFRDMRKLKGIHLAAQASDVDAIVGDLGPDALEVPCDTYRARLMGTRRQLKPALMDQSLLAGLGNLCVDEILWRARLHPRRGSRGLTDSELTGLCRETHSMLRQAVRDGRVPDRASWLTGHRDDPSGQCPRCHTQLRQDRVGGRATVWCPRCQQS